MSIKKFVKRLLLLSIVLVLLFLHFYAPRFITEIRNPIIGMVKAAPHISASYASDQGRLLDYPSFDGTRHRAFLSFSRQDTARGTVIMVHGIRSRKEHFRAISQQLAERGYHAVAVDLRAHGQSEGSHCTFGVKEKRDITALVDHLQAEGLAAGPIGIWGQSLGGAVAIQALAHEPRLDFGVIESTFADFETITNDYCAFYAGFNIPFLTNYLVYRAGKIAGFDPEEARPSEKCREITQPVLMVHGGKDRRISIEYGRLNFANLASRDKEFHVVEGANHLNVWKVGGAEYLEKVFGFVGKQALRENHLGSVQ